MTPVYSNERQKMQSIRQQVREFMLAAGQPVSDTPNVPAPDRVRLRMRLIAEEVLELFDEAYMPHKQELTALHEAFQTILFKDPDTKNIDVAMVADALADIDYVVEGMRQEMGINGTRVAEEVHRANMAKFAEGSYKREDGKQMKPPDWRPPNIQGVLDTQNEFRPDKKYGSARLLYHVRGFEVRVGGMDGSRNVAAMFSNDAPGNSEHRQLVDRIIDHANQPIDYIEVLEHRVLVHYRMVDRETAVYEV